MNMLTALKQKNTIVRITSYILGIVLFISLIDNKYFAFGANDTIKPARPKVTVALGGDKSSIVISIKKTNNADGYAIYARIPGKKKFVEIATIDNNEGKAVSYVYSDIVKGKYTFRVKAYKKTNGKKKWGKYSKFAKINIKKLLNDGSALASFINNNYPGLQSLADEGILEIKFEPKKDTIILGKWDLEYFENDSFTGDGKKENLEWEVLEYSEDKKSARVISKYLLTQKPFNDINADVTWENCSLRKWLNDDFYNSAFTDNEKKLILTSYVVNEDTRDVVYGTKHGGEDTYDSLFLLSLSDLQYYFPNDPLNSNSYNRISKYIDGQVDKWWLRSLAGNQYSVAHVRTEGYVDYGYGKSMNSDDMPAGIANSLYGNCGVRPSFWISLTPEIIKNNNLSISDDYRDEIDQNCISVYMGQFDLGIDKDKHDGIKETLKWQIFDYDKDQKKLLLVSKCFVADMSFNDDDQEDVTWEKCSLRAWLNNDFYETAFSKNQKRVILKSDLNNQNCDDTYGKAGGNNTIDKVFLLSLEEVDRYYPYDRDKFAYDRICSFCDGVISPWWLRTPPTKKQITATIDEIGLANISHRVNSYSLGVRPAIWINLK